jgi:hypothetical protein
MERKEPADLSQRMYPRAMVDDLARSKITRAEISIMQLGFLDNEATKDYCGFDDLTAYLIPYFSIDGKPVPVTEFSRIRFLSTAEELEALKLDPRMRYRQIAGSVNRFYLTPVPDDMKTWREAARDPSIPLAFVEGEKKAFVGAWRCGIHHIGLGGVDNWVQRINDQDVQMQDGGLSPKKKPGRPRKLVERREPIKDFMWFEWSGRTVYIIFDWPDIVVNQQVKTALDRLVIYLNKLEANVRVVRLGTDPTSNKVALDDYIAAHGADAARKLIKQAPPALERPLIDIDDQPRTQIERSLAALDKANRNAPTFFIRQSVVVRLRREANDVRGTWLEELTREGWHSELVDRVDFVSGSKSVWPTDNLLRGLAGQTEYPFRWLKQVARAPLFTKDGVLVATEGFHEDAQIYLALTEDLRGMRDIPTTPTANDVARAVKTIHWPIRQFPFKDNASYAHAVATMLLPFVRPLIDGHVPIHAFRTPQERIGKGKLVNCLCLPALGHDIPVMPTATNCANG